MAPINKKSTATDDFLPASSSTSKARKLQLKQSIKKPSSSKSKPSTFLSTQPSTSTHDDDDLMDLERLPLYPSQPKTLAGSSKTTSAQAQAAMDTAGDESDDDDTIMIDPSTLSLPTPVSRIPISQLIAAAGGTMEALAFPAISHVATSGLTQRRKIGIPIHRMTPLKRDWIKVYSPLVEELGLQVRMNLKKRWVEMKVSFLLDYEVDKGKSTEESFGLMIVCFLCGRLLNTHRLLRVSVELLIS